MNLQEKKESNKSTHSLFVVLAGVICRFVGSLGEIMSRKKVSRERYVRPREMGAEEQGKLPQVFYCRVRDETALFDLREKRY